MTIVKQIQVRFINRWAAIGSIIHRPPASPLAWNSLDTEVKKHAHWPLAGLLVVFVILALIYSIFLPLGESADEVSHFALVRFIAEQKRPPLSIQEREAVGKKGDASPLYHALVALLTQHVNVASLRTLPLQAEPRRYIPFDAARTNMIFHTEDETFPFRGIVLAWHLGRLTSIPLGVITLLGIYLTVLSIYPHRPYLALAATGFAAFIPSFVINSSVINDDNLAVPLVTLSVYFMVRVLQSDNRRRTLIILGGLIGLAAITKYHGLVLLFEVTLALMVLAWYFKWPWRQLVTRWAWVMGSFVVAAGWWFVFLFWRFNQIAELGLVAGLLAPMGDPVITASAGGFVPLQSIYWLEWIEPLFQTFWVVYGNTQVFAPKFVYQIIIVPTLITILGLTCLGHNLLKTRHRWSPIRFDIALLALHGLVYLAIVFVRFQTHPTVVGAQGRHLFPALVSIAFFSVLGLSAFWKNNDTNSKPLKSLLEG